jgi:3-hydroxyacyl-CoA dehydrogenase
VIQPRRRVRRVAVLGAGVMGSQIAAHFANAHIPVVLFEQAPAAAPDPREPARRAIAAVAQQRPAPLGAPGLAAAIEPAAYASDLERLADCDVVVETIVERLETKQALLERIAPALEPNTIVASNTSGLSIAHLNRALPPALRPQFCGVHFFNPPRYMHLVEVTPHPGTDAGMLYRLEGFLTTALGKGVVFARDTPGFIANRIGMFALAAAVHHAERLQIPFDLADRLLGLGIGRQKSGSFRTIDLVGLDTFIAVLDHLHATLVDDPWRWLFVMPDWLRERRDAGALGQKRGTGVYRRGEAGIEVYEPRNAAYRRVTDQLEARVRDALAEPDAVRKAALIEAIDHPQAEFIRASHRDLLHYCAYHLASLAPSAREVDLAMRWGYGWALGPFELWQLLGWPQVAAQLQRAIDAGETLAAAPLPAWARESRRTGVHGARGSWSAEAHMPVPRSGHRVYRRQMFPPGLVGEPKPSAPTLWQDDSVRLWDAADNVAGLSLRQLPHTLTAAVLDGLLQALEWAEREVRAVVLWQDVPPFCLGLDLHALQAAQAAGDDRAMADLVSRLQAVNDALRHAPLPVVAAPVGGVLSGGLELALACDARVAAFETRAGLVEAGVGLIPAGGGCARLAQRAWALSADGDPLAWLQRYFDAIVLGRITGSALEGDWWTGGDRIVLHSDEVPHAAKSQALALADAGYRPPLPGARFAVAGAPGIEALRARLPALAEIAALSEHDHRLAEHLATVLCGGAVAAGTWLAEQDILRGEREAFGALAATRASAERIEHMLATGERLRRP